MHKEYARPVTCKVTAHYLGVQNELVSYPGPSHKSGRRPGTRCLRMRNIFRLFFSVKNIIHLPCPRGIHAKNYTNPLAPHPGPYHKAVCGRGLAEHHSRWIYQSLLVATERHLSHHIRIACSCSGLSTIPAFPTFYRAYDTAVANCASFEDNTSDNHLRDTNVHG